MRQLPVDRAVYLVDDETKTYRYGRRNPDWPKLSPEQNLLNKESLEGYTRHFPDGRTKIFHYGP